LPAASPTTCQWGAKAAMTDRVCRPMDPVEPRTTTRRGGTEALIKKDYTPIRRSLFLTADGGGLAGFRGATHKGTRPSPLTTFSR